MNRSAQHTALCRDIECALSRLPDVLTTANPSGIADYHGARVPYGAFGAQNANGQWGGGPDILVVAAPARLIAVECKTGDADRTAAQRACQRRLERVGVRYVVARDVESVVRVVEAVRGGGE